MGNEIWSKKENYFYILFFFKNCTSLGPNWSILLGSWKGQIEKKFQSRIHRGQCKFWRGRNDICPTRLAFGVNLALFILQCTPLPGQDVSEEKSAKTNRVMTSLFFQTTAIYEVVFRQILCDFWDRNILRRTTENHIYLFFEGNDVSVSLPTSCGKSLIY